MPKDEIDIVGFLQPLLTSRAEVIDDGLLAAADFGHVDGHRPAVHAVFGRAPGQVGDAGGGDHRLGRRATDVDASAPDVRLFDDRRSTAGGGQVQGQWFACLPGAQDNRVKSLRRHDAPPR